MNKSLPSAFGIRLCITSPGQAVWDSGFVLEFTKGSIWYKLPYTRDIQTRTVIGYVAVPKVLVTVQRCNSLW